MDLRQGEKTKKSKKITRINFENSRRKITAENSDRDAGAFDTEINAKVRKCGGVYTIYNYDLEKVPGSLKVV